MEKVARKEEKERKATQAEPRTPQAQAKAQLRDVSSAEKRITSEIVLKPLRRRSQKEKVRSQEQKKEPKVNGQRKHNGTRLIHLQASPPKDNGASGIHVQEKEEEHHSKV